MKKLLTTFAICIFSLSSSFCEEDSRIKIKEPKDFSYTTTGTFSWACFPAGLNIGVGKRWYEDNTAWGVSMNLSASLSVIPLVDILLEGLYLIDDHRYVGLQLGVGAGRNLLTHFNYKDENGEKTEVKVDDWILVPILKFIPFGTEWSSGGRRQFMHVAFFPVGLSFNYGWEI